MKTDPRLDKITDCLYRIAIKCIIIRNGKVLLVKEDDDEWWSFPGGGIDHGETVTQALIRELSEELGLPSEEVTFDDKILLFNIGSIVKGIPKANVFYRVDIKNPEKIKPTDWVVESKWFKPDKLSALSLSPSTGSKDVLIKLLEERIKS